MRGRTAGVDDALGDPLVVEVRDLLPQVVVLQQRRTPPARPQRVVGVSDPGAVRGGQERPLLRHRRRSPSIVLGIVTPALPRAPPRG